MKTTVRLAAGLMMVATCLAHSRAQGFNYDEAAVPAYTLPDPLVLADGTPVTDARTWKERRRPEILHLFEAHVYGAAPGPPSARR